jgi:hypothetical protein
MLVCTHKHKTRHPQVDAVYYCAHIDKYITCARDGSFRLWQGSDLAHVKTVRARRAVGAAAALVCAFQRRVGAVRCAAPSATSSCAGSPNHAVQAAKV